MILKQYLIKVIRYMLVPCAYPERFVKGGQTLTVIFSYVFLVVELREDLDTTRSGVIIGPPAKRHLNELSLAGR